MDSPVDPERVSGEQSPSLDSSLPLSAKRSDSSITDAYRSIGGGRGGGGGADGIDGLRDEARALIAEGRYAAAEALLLRALQFDPIDADGATRHLLGLACFHQERWKTAADHLVVSLHAAENSEASELLDRACVNLQTGIENAHDPLPPFDVRRLGRPAASDLRPPKESGVALPATEKEPLPLRLAHLAWSRVAGTIAETGVVVASWFRDRSARFDFESWDRRGTLRGVLEIGARRHDLNGDKLQSRERGVLVGGQPPGQLRPPWTERFRTATGAWTTDDPLEGAAGTAIQRSGAPHAHRRCRLDDPLPSPREVSRRILAPQAGRPRREVPFLNLFTIAWIQAMVHDWVSHKPTPAAGIHSVPLAEDDPFRARYGIASLQVPASAINPIPGAPELTYLSEVTHWWDASHLYGSDQRTQNRLRTEAGRRLEGGRMRIAGDFLPMHSSTGIEDTGFARNWWIGLDLIHTLFVKHHNFICDELKRNEPHLGTSDELFHTARLINSAIMAKIHTVEWTPAVLPNRKVVFGMETNWWGLVQASRRKVSERTVHSPWEPRHPVVGGIVGGTRDHHGKAYAMTEEFVEVYRLHAGMPDEIRLRGEAAIPADATRGKAARRLMQQFGMSALLEAFGHQHMPALENNNYPAFLCEMSMPGQAVIDLGTIDILRARERGVPPYNEFRSMLGLKPIERFEDLGCSAETVDALEELYGHDGVDKLDLLAGTACELWRPEGFGFGETMFTVFIQMASRRLEADPFYTEKFDERHYTRTGMALVEAATLKGVLLQHHPELAPLGLDNVANAFEPWGTTAATAPNEHPLHAIVNY